MTSRLARTVCVVTLACLPLVGCGASKIDSHKAELEIAKGYEKQVKDADVASVDCPGEIDGEVGTTAVCTLTLENGASGNVDIKVLDEEGQIRWDVATPSK